MNETARMRASVGDSQLHYIAKEKRTDDIERLDLSLVYSLALLIVVSLA